jgi:hypothetical protein
MSQFKVEFIRSGVKHTPSYVRSIEAAIRKAQSKGWYGDKGGDCWDTCPEEVRISLETGGRYELVARVDRDKITAIDIESRPSVRLAKERIKECNLAIHEADILKEIINRIAKGKGNDSQ